MNKSIESWHKRRRPHRPGMSGVVRQTTIDNSLSYSLSRPSHTMTGCSQDVMAPDSAEAALESQTLADLQEVLATDLALAILDKLENAEAPHGAETATYSTDKGSVLARPASHLKKHHKAAVAPVPVPSWYSWQAWKPQVKLHEPAPSVKWHKSEGGQGRQLLEEHDKSVCSQPPLPISPSLFP